MSGFAPPFQGLIVLLALPKALPWAGLSRAFGPRTTNRANKAVCKQVEVLQADDLAKLSTRRRGKLLVLDVGARITSANQKWMEVPGDEDDGVAGPGAGGFEIAAATTGTPRA